MQDENKPLVENDSGDSKNSERFFLESADILPVRRCSNCGERKTLENFRKRVDKRSSWTGLDSTCKQCNLAKLKKWNSENPEKNSRRVTLKLWKEKHGKSLEDYEKIFLSQEGKCAICGKSEEIEKKKGKRSLSLDHCHATGELRGFLCGACNLGIGMFSDDPELLKAAARYLRRSRCY